LERTRLFLPQIAEANLKLAKQPKDKINIENIDENQSGIIKMDLGLGVFDCIDNESTNKNPILPKKKDILDAQKDMNFNILLNPTELPEDYTKPLIQMLSNSDDSSESHSGISSDSESESESESESDSSDSDSSNSTSDSSADMGYENSNEVKSERGDEEEEKDDDGDIEMKNWI